MENLDMQTQKKIEEHQLKEQQINQYSQQQNNLIIESEQHAGNLEKGEAPLLKADETIKKTIVKDVFEMRDNHFIQNENSQSQNRVNKAKQEEDAQQVMLHELAFAISAYEDKDDLTGQYAEIVAKSTNLVREWLRAKNAASRINGGGDVENKLRGYLLASLKISVDAYLKSHGKRQFTTRGQNRNKTIRDAAAKLNDILEGKVSCISGETIRYAKDAVAEGAALKSSADFSIYSDEEEKCLNNIKEERTKDIEGYVTLEADTKVGDLSRMSYENLAEWLRASRLVNGNDAEFQGLINSYTTLIHSEEANVETNIERMKRLAGAYLKSHRYSLGRTVKFREAFCRLFTNEYFDELRASIRDNIRKSDHDLLVSATKEKIAKMSLNELKEWSSSLSRTLAGGEADESLMNLLRSTISYVELTNQYQNHIKAEALENGGELFDRVVSDLHSLKNSARLHLASKPQGKYAEERKAMCEKILSPDFINQIREETLSISDEHIDLAVTAAKFVRIDAENKKLHDQKNQDEKKLTQEDEDEINKGFVVEARRNVFDFNMQVLELEAQFEQKKIGEKEFAKRLYLLKQDALGSARYTRNVLSRCLAGIDKGDTGSFNEVNVHITKADGSSYNFNDEVRKKLTEVYSDAGLAGAYARIERNLARCGKYANTKFTETRGEANRRMFITNRRLGVYDMCNLIVDRGRFQDFFTVHDRTIDERSAEIKKALAGKKITVGKYKLSYEQLINKDFKFMVSIVEDVMKYMKNIEKGNYQKAQFANAMLKLRSERLESLQREVDRYAYADGKEKLHAENQPVIKPVSMTDSE